jgi:DNA polymerase III delta subunit
MSTEKKGNPPVLVVGGSDVYQRRRLISKITETRRGQGWNVLPIDGKEPDALDSVFAMSAMFEAPTLCVVVNPEKLSPAVVIDHLQSPDPKVVLLLVTESDKPSGPFFDLAQKKVFTLPPFYKLEEHAAAFVQSEVTALGGSFDPPSLATSLVRRVGTDLGVLSFEAQKAVLFAGTGTPITATHLRETLAPLAETDGSSIIEALGTKNQKKLAAELQRYQSTRGGDPTIELCGRILTPALTRWLQAAHLAEAGMSASGAAGSVGANPWYWEHKILPHALRWKVSGCARLIGIVADAQTLVFRGGLAPFTYLEASFLAFLRD